MYSRTTSLRSSDALNAHEDGPRSGPPAQAPGFLCVCIRIPKSGSWSLHNFLSLSFANRRIWYLPNTLDLDSRLSTIQRLRQFRTQRRNLLTHYGTRRMGRAVALINRSASAGDLITGGHIDFPFVQTHLDREIRIITLLRNPFDRLRSEYEYARWAYERKSVLGRLDCSVAAKIASKFSLEGYVDFMLEHSSIYGNIACRYLGWTGEEPLGPFLARHVFACGLLECSDLFASEVSEKLGKRIAFPHVNATPRASHYSFSAAERHKIRLLYDRDLALYDWVCANI